MKNFDKTKMLYLILILNFFSCQNPIEPMKDPIINIQTDFIEIENGKIEFPLEEEKLFKVIGDSDTTFVKPANDILVWQKKGIIAYKSKGGKIFALDFYFEKDEFDFCPNQIFEGSIKVKDLIISSSTKISDLKNYGFIPDKYDDDYLSFELEKIFIDVEFDEENGNILSLEIGNIEEEE